MGVVELLYEKVDGRDQFVDVHVESFCRKKCIAARTESVFNRAGKLPSLLIRIFLSRLEVLHRPTNILRHGVAVQKGLHRFGIANDSTFRQ